MNYFILLGDYIVENPEQTLDNLCLDMMIKHKDTKLKCLRFSGDENLFTVFDNYGFNLFYGMNNTLFYFSREGKIEVPSMFIVKLLTEGKEDLI